ncbi:hypothetical protein PINS_up013039 [Pythium insidiosum]|nr:hypothetical protein PINS_up013039 [Pythium insidiosum]
MSTTDSDDELHLAVIPVPHLRRGWNRMRQPQHSRRRLRRGAGRRTSFIGPSATATTRSPSTHLTAGIQELQRRRSELLALHGNRLLMQADQQRAFFVTIAADYYRAFQFGSIAPRLPEIWSFLNACTEPEVFEFGSPFGSPEGDHASAIGLGALMEQWQRYTALFPRIEIQVDSTESVQLIESDNSRATTAAIVVVHSRMQGRITTQTVATVLPHVSHESSLVAALLGRMFTCPTQLRFFFNAAGRIIRLELITDFCEGFVSLDGLSLRDVARIMQHAAITQSALLPAVRDMESGE